MKLLLGCAFLNFFFVATNALFRPNPANIAASVLCGLVGASNLAVWAAVRHDR
jgi:hypothetical protein